MRGLACKTRQLANVASDPILLEPSLEKDCMNHQRAVEMCALVNREATSVQESAWQFRGSNGRARLVGVASPSAVVHIKFHNEPMHTWLRVCRRNREETVIKASASGHLEPVLHQHFLIKDVL